MSDIPESNPSLKPVEQTASIDVPVSAAANPESDSPSPNIEVPVQESAEATPDPVEVVDDVTPTQTQPIPVVTGNDNVTISEQVTSVPSKFSPKELWMHFMEKVSGAKRKRLDKILVLAAKKKKITNDDVQKLVGVSDAMATRYLKELVQEGKLKQSGIRASTVYEHI